MKWEAEDGSDVKEFDVFDFPGGGVSMAMYNLDDSIRDFARACMLYALTAAGRFICRPKTPL